MLNSDRIKALSYLKRTKPEDNVDRKLMEGCEMMLRDDGTGATEGINSHRNGCAEQEIKSQLAQNRKAMKLKFTLCTSHMITIHDHVLPRAGVIPLTT
ncbi:hypothetical protein E4U40_004687 [Claviceps sp. LM458 group G5]|nr:hypothetical protein E4U40_004687 [Claviceps sp. LM458 group G5]